MTRDILLAYIDEDLENMTTAELGRVYRFIRREIIADIPGRNKSSKPPDCETGASDD